MMLEIRVRERCDFKAEQRGLKTFFAGLVTGADASIRLPGRPDAGIGIWIRRSWKRCSILFHFINIDVSRLPVKAEGTFEWNIEKTPVIL
jgi:hypothetical protein